MSANDELQAHTCEKIMEFYEKPQDYVKKSHNMTENEQKSEKNLTEQWENGELERGKKYWCKLTDGTSEICYLWLQTNHFTFLTGYQSRCLPDEDIAEVLAPVPSYEKYKCLETGIILANAVIKNTEEENTNLKELLRKAKGIITAYRLTGNQNTYPNNDMKECVAKIDEVLK